MSDYTVTLYSKPSCMPCKLTKRVLDEGGVTYSEYDVTQFTGLQDVIRELGYQGVPVVIVQMEDGADHWYGYEPNRLRALVAIAGSAA
jgi:glutaredoxin-like protein NrdH